MKLGIYVINLDRSPDRLRVVADCMRRASLPFTQIEAVDGRALEKRFPYPVHLRRVRERIRPVNQAYRISLTRVSGIAAQPG